VVWTKDTMEQQSGRYQNIHFFVLFDTSAYKSCYNNHQAGKNPFPFCSVLFAGNADTDYVNKTKNRISYI